MTGNSYNFRTQEFDTITEVTARDFVPQETGALGLFDCRVAQGDSSLQALEETLRALIGSIPR